MLPRRSNQTGYLHEHDLGFPEGKGGGLILMWHTTRTTPYAIGDGYSRFIVNVSEVDALSVA